MRANYCNGLYYLSFHLRFYFVLLLLYISLVFSFYMNGYFSLYLVQFSTIVFYSLINLQILVSFKAKLFTFLFTSMNFSFSHFNKIFEYNYIFKLIRFFNTYLKNYYLGKTEGKININKINNFHTIDK